MSVQIGTSSINSTGGPYYAQKTIFVIFPAERFPVLLFQVDCMPSLCLQHTRKISPRYLVSAIFAMCTLWTFSPEPRVVRVSYSIPGTENAGKLYWTMCMKTSQWLSSWRYNTPHSPHSPAPSAFLLSHQVHVLSSTACLKSEKISH